MARNELATYYEDHRLLALSTVAVVAGAVFAYLQLRKAPAPVPAGTPAAAGVAGLMPGAGFGASDVQAAYGAGAAAASSGFDAGLGLGQSALGLAGDVVSSQAGVAATLAQSQASVAATQGQSLTDALASILSLFQPASAPVPVTPPPAVLPPQPLPSPTPAPAPAPTSWTVRLTVRGLYNPGTGQTVYTSSGPTVGTLFTVSPQIWNGAYYHIIAGTYKGYLIPLAHAVKL